jgi:hypothetical protein
MFAQDFGSASAGLSVIVFVIGTFGFRICFVFRASNFEISGQAQLKKPSLVPARPD